MTKMVTDVICPFCGTLCDDLEVEVSDDGKTIMDVYNACSIGAEKFMHAQAKDRVKRPRMQQPDGSYKESPRRACWPRGRPATTRLRSRHLRTVPVRCHRLSRYPLDA